MLSAKKLTLAAAALFAGVSAADAQQSGPDVFHNESMQTRIFVLRNRIEGHPEFHMETYRGMSDDAVGVVCTWNAEGDFNAETKTARNVRYTSSECHASRDIPAGWLGGDVSSLNAGQTRKVTREGNTIVEVSKSGPTSFNIVSHYIRRWDLDTNQVSITANESMTNGKKSQYYLQRNLGTYPIPDNGYVAKLQAELK